MAGLRTRYRKGQAVEVPAEVLDAAGVEDGTELEFDVTPLGGIVVHPVTDVRHGVEGEDNSYELDEFIAEVRAEHSSGR